jgi:signal transduction histidine kinase
MSIATRPVSHASADRHLAGALAACPVAFASPLRRTPAGLGCRFDDSGLEIIGLLTSIETNTECIGECRDRRLAAKFTTRFACFIRCLMNTVPHDFVTVEMRGLKAALVARARERRVSVSVVVRDAVAQVLPSNEEAAIEASRAPVDMDVPSGTVKVSIRLTTNEVRRLDAGAKAAGLSRAAFLSGLIEGVSVLSSGGRRDHLAALISSNAELSTLSRNIRHLADLLRRSESRAAQEYRSMLDTMAGDIDRHLNLAGHVLTQMQPALRVVTATDRRSLRAKEKN